MQSPRNIINLDEVRCLIKELSDLYPNLAPYIQSKVLKYLKHDAYLVERSFCGLWLKGKIALGIASSLERKIYKNYGCFGRYQLVPCGEGLTKRIRWGLDFFITNKISKHASFKEVLYEADRAKLGLPESQIKILTLGVDYDIVAALGAFEVWELSSALAYEQEGLLMKNCIGKSEKRKSAFSILSVRESKTKNPVINIKLKKSNGEILEAKEKVNQEIKQYEPVFEKVKKFLRLKDKI